MVTNWYGPFLISSLSPFSLDPWAVWLSSGGIEIAFPYGYAMWLILLPLTCLSEIAGVGALCGYGLTLLLCDIALLLVLDALIPRRQKLLIIVYWFSPIIIIASYVYGFNDLIPALLVAFSLLAIKRHYWIAAGFSLIAAVSAKLSMIAVLPFFLIYFFSNKSVRQYFRKFSEGLLLGFILLGAPFLMTYSGMSMTFGNPEIRKIYQIALTFSGTLSVFIVPLVYIVMLYLIWRVKCLNFDLFEASLGLTFLMIVLITPASPGWFVWSTPFLALYQAKSGRLSIILVGTFSLLYAIGIILVTPINFTHWGEIDLSSMGSQSDAAWAISLIYTCMIALGLVLAMRIWRESIGRNDYFRLSRKPFVIGVAGDSGAGKDTFSDSISGLFGSHSAVKLSGDDYHLWDRQKPMWQVMTHLNPSANDLETFSGDLISLVDGRKIQSRHYNHQTGKMSRPYSIKSNDLIIGVGLHALYLPILRDCCDLKIFLDIDDDLRKYFKIKRDVHERGHSIERVLASINNRLLDSERFIRPQSTYADLIFSLRPIHPRILNDVENNHPLRLKLEVTTRHGFNELSLRRVLVGICGLHVDMSHSDDGSEIYMTIEGDAKSEDVAMAIEILCPQILEFLDIPPKWEDGVTGLMQLITVTHISQALTRRII